MNIVERTLAVLGLALCVAMLVRMALPHHTRTVVDRRAQRAWWWVSDLAQRIARRPRANRADAARVAREAIERAQRKRTLH